MEMILSAAICGVTLVVSSSVKRSVKKKLA